MHQQDSKYAGHPRITWFGRGGTVAYIDYISATKSFFIGSDGQGGFKVLAPDGMPGSRTGFATIDDGIAYALAVATPE